MKNKITAITLAILTLLLSFVSCTPEPSLTPTKELSPTTSAIPSTVPGDTPTNPKTEIHTSPSRDTEEYPNEFTLTLSPFIYGDFVYYLSINYDNGNSILKYQDLKDIQENGPPVYDNAADVENPFRGLQCEVLVDKEATEKNGGVPVLIVGVSGVNYTGITNYYTQIYRFDQGTNKMTEIFKEQKKLRLDGMCLYGDTLYFKGFYRNSGNTDNTYHVYYSMNKNGGKATKHSYTGYVSEYVGIYKDTMYFYDMISGDVIITDLNYENDQVLTNIATQSISVMKPTICGEYIYYTKNIKETDLGGCTAISGDICRRSLENLKEELIIEGVTKASVSGDNIIYGLLSEASVETITAEYFGKEQTYSFRQNPILYIQNIKSGESKVFLDISDNEEERKYLGLMGIQDNYALFYFDTTSDPYAIYRLYDLESGKISSFSSYNG